MRNSFLPLLVSLLLIHSITPLPAAELTLSENAATPYRIVTSPIPSPEEQSAATWLAESLEQVTAAKFPILPDNAPDLPPTTIRLRFDPQLHPEEWHIRTDGQTLHLTGGNPRGLIYAVCEFLETHVGTLRLDPFNEYVPKADRLAIPPLDRRGRPAFESRVIFTGFPYAHPHPDAQGINGRRFRVWNKEHSHVGPNVGDYPRLVPEGVHTFGRFLSAAEFAKSHPEYFSMDADGKRMTDDMGNPALWIQLCATNPDVQRITLERAKQMLRDDALAAKKEHREPAHLVVLSQNDNTQNLCLCPECSKVTTREGSQSGPLLEYVNHVARGLQSEFPKAKVLTEAYNFTLQPPKSLHSEPNVIVRYCDNYGLSDMTRPLQAPRNAERLKLLTDWSDKASRLAIWDYWRTIEEHPPGYLAPSSNVRAIHADLQLFRHLGVRTLVVESEDFMGAGLNDNSMSCDLQSFMPLRAWLGMKLADNPEQDLENLLDRFCQGYYGPAARPMQELLELIEDQQRKVPLNSADRRRHVWLEALGSPEFFTRAYSILDAALESAPLTDRHLVNIRRERIIIDSAYLWTEGRLRRLDPVLAEKLPHRTRVLQRHREDWHAYLASVFDEQGQAITKPFVEKGLQLLEKLRTEDTDQSRNAIAVQEQDITFDGHLDEPFWNNAQPLKLLPRDPTTPNDDTTTAVRFAWTPAALYVGFKQPTDKTSAVWEVSLMTPDMQGVQLELFARPGNVASPYYYRYPTTGMLAVRDRESKSKVQIATHNQETHIEFRIPWTDIDTTPIANNDLLLNIATFPNPNSTTPAYISSPALIGSAPAYHPMYYEHLTLTP